VGLMPYHLEKGHFLLLLEDTLNEGIEAVVDNNSAITFPARWAAPCWIGSSRPGG